MKSRNSKILKHTSDRRTYKVFKAFEEPYWDEGIVFYPRYKKGFKNPTKQIMNYQRRMYRSWKYNRKNQWK